MDGRSLAIIENYMKGDVLIRSQVLKGCQRTAVNLLYYPYGSSELQRILLRGDKLVPHRLWMQSGHRVVLAAIFSGVSLLATAGGAPLGASAARGEGEGEGNLSGKGGALRDLRALLDRALGRQCAG